MAHFHFSFWEFFQAIGNVTYHAKDGKVVTQDFMTPGLRFKLPYGPLELISLGVALIFGTAGLPHILVRFYTVPDAKTARYSVVWAMFIIGSFYIMTTFLGFGAATIMGRDFISKNGGTNMSAPLLAKVHGRRCLLCLYLRDCIRHHPCGGCRIDHYRIDVVCPRCVDECRSPRGRA